MDQFEKNRIVLNAIFSNGNEKIKDVLENIELCSTKKKFIDENDQKNFNEKY